MVYLTSPEKHKALKKLQMEKKCKNCGKIIIEDWMKYLKENPNQVWLQCCYCFHMEKIR